MRRYITKNDLVNMVKSNGNLPLLAVRATIESVFEVMAKQLSLGNNIYIDGLGKLKITERKAKKGYNMNTKEVVDIPECKIVKFVKDEQIVL